MFANIFFVSTYSQGNSRKITNKQQNPGILLSNIFIEKNREYLPKELFQIEADNQFKYKITQIEVSSPTTFWFKINLNKNFSKNYLEIFCPNTLGINVFSLNNMQDSNNSASNNFIELKTFKYGNEYFDINIPNYSNQILVKLKVAKYSHFEIKISDDNSFFKKERILNAFYGFSLGIFILLILYHFILYIKVKEKLYLYYIALVFNAALLVSHGNHLVTIPVDVLFNELIIDLFQVSAIALTIVYLDLLKQFNIAYKLLLTFIPLVIICRLLDILVPGLFSKSLIQAESFLLYLAITVISIISSLRNYKSEKWFILPWIILLVGQILFSIYSIQLFNINEIGRHALEIGVLLNNILLALVFGNKLTHYKNEKKIAEFNELIALSERDKIIHEQNVILETLISERNSEIIDKINLLAKQKQDIEIQNKNIKIRNEELDIINSKLIDKNNEISDQNHELEKQNQLLEEIVNIRTKRLLEEKERSIVADKLKTSFLNNLDQEIQTPMNSITGFSTMLFDSSLTKEKRNEYLGIINYNVDLLLESIDNMVLLARIQANAIKPKFKQFELNTLFINCKEYFEEKTLNRSPIVKLNIDSPHSNHLITINSDYDKIWQVVTKLLNFAIKYTTPGKIYLFYKLLESISGDKETNQHLQIIIKFSGLELEENYNFIFGQQNKMEINKNKSTFINEFGIDIAKGLIEILNGEIEFQSNNDRDIIFSNKIPVLLINEDI